MDRLVRWCTDGLLVSVTACFLAGSTTAFLCASRLAGLPVVAVVSVLLCLTAVAALLLHSRHRPLTTLPLFFLTGMLHTHLAMQPVADPNHLAALVTDSTKVTLIGRIHSMAEYNGERTRFELACESLLIHDAARNNRFQPVRGKVLLSVPGSTDPMFVPGTTIMTMATVEPIRPPRSPGTFDYRLQMATRSIAHTGWIQSAREILPVEEPARSAWHTLTTLPERVRQNTATFLNSRFSPEVAGLYQALLIGSVVNVPPQIMELFKDNGCFHILSISGLHLSLLGVFCVALLTWLLKRSTWLLLHTHVPTLALGLTAPLLLLYTFIAGFDIPAFRALVMALLVIYAVVLRRQRTLIHLIAAAALLVLALSPLALFTPSFQLSFAAVLAINLIYPRLPVFLAADRHRDRHRPIVKMLRVLQSMLYVSLAATAGTLPILLYHFNRFSLTGPVMNLCIEPLLCLWALPCGLAAIPLVPLAPDLAAILLHIGSQGILLAVWLSKAVAGFISGSVWTITPTPLEIALYFVVLFLLLRRPRTSGQLALIAALTLVLAGSFSRSLWWPFSSRELMVSFLDVGQGASALVRFPDGGTVLIDGGGYRSERFDTGEQFIAPFLWHHRIWRLDDLVITHPHHDHYNGLPFVAARFQPQRVFVNGDPGEEPPYQQLLATLNQQGAKVQTSAGGDILRSDGGATLTCLGMPGLYEPAERFSTNSRSLVLRLDHGLRSFLFPADIERVAENRLIRAGVPLQSDVLLAPHHGSRTSGGENFLDAVGPALIIVSAGPRRQDVMPAPDNLEIWRQKKIPFLITARHGTVTCRTDGKSMNASPFAGKELFLDESTGQFVHGK